MGGDLAIEVFELADAFRPAEEIQCSVFKTFPFPPLNVLCGYLIAT